VLTQRWKISLIATNPYCLTQIRKLMNMFIKYTWVVVLFSKLDRLSRDVHAISGLMAGPVRFVVAELGINVDPFALYVYAALAEKERRMLTSTYKIIVY
jgi:hypothetical protein